MEKSLNPYFTGNTSTRTIFIVFLVIAGVLILILLEIPQRDQRSALINELYNSLNPYFTGNTSTSAGNVSIGVSGKQGLNPYFTGNTSTSQEVLRNISFLNF